MQGTNVAPQYAAPIKSRGRKAISSEMRDQFLVIIEQLMDHKFARPFSQPVDHVLLRIPDYPVIVKNPMDLGTIKNKLISGKYKVVNEFLDDVELVWSNCYLYNPIGHFLRGWVNELAAEFNKMLESMRKGTLNKRRRRLTEKQKRLDAQKEEQQLKKTQPKTPRTNRRKRKLTVTEERNEWADRYSQLVQFHQIHGHCKVPVSYDETLSKWVKDMRKQKKQGLVTTVRAKKLDELGFEWVPGKGRPRMASRPRTSAPKKTRNPKPTPKKRKIANTTSDYGSGSESEGNDWDERFQELIDFNKMCGHFNVPKDWYLNSELGWWVWQLRCKRRQGALDRGKVRKLNSIGFVWNEDDEYAAWEARYEELEEYFKKEGTCLVEITEENRELNNWLVSMKKSKKMHVLSQYWINKLNQLNFEWDLGIDTQRGLLPIEEFGNVLDLGEDDDIVVEYSSDDEICVDFPDKKTDELWGVNCVADRVINSDTDTDMDSDSENN